MIERLDNVPPEKLSLPNLEEKIRKNFYEGIGALVVAQIDLIGESYPDVVKAHNEFVNRLSADKLDFLYGTFYDLEPSTECTLKGILNRREDQDAIQVSDDSFYRDMYNTFFVKCDDPTVEAQRNEKEEVLELIDRISKIEEIHF